jgi:hypothetical protein
MHHSAVGVNGRCLRRSVRRYGSASSPDCRAPMLTWDFTNLTYLMQR